jgi:hypothetical protein
LSSSCSTRGSSERWTWLQRHNTSHHSTSDFIASGKTWCSGFPYGTEKFRATTFPDSVPFHVPTSVRTNFEEIGTSWRFQHVRDPRGFWMMIPVSQTWIFVTCGYAGSKGHFGCQFETNFEGDNKDISLAILNIGVGG